MQCRNEQRIFSILLCMKVDTCLKINTADFVLLRNSNYWLYQRLVWIWERCVYSRKLKHLQHFILKQFVTAMYNRNKAQSNTNFYRNRSEIILYLNISRFPSTGTAISWGRGPSCRNKNMKMKRIRHRDYRPSWWRSQSAETSNIAPWFIEMDCSPQSPVTIQIYAHFSLWFKIDMWCCNMQYPMKQSNARFGNISVWRGAICPDYK